MEIQPVSQPQTAAASQTATAGGELGRNEFLNLLVTQLQNQDPLEPMDGQQMIAQLAQFSALEQMQNLNQAVEDGHRETVIMQSLALAGHGVCVTLENGAQVTGTVDQVSWNDGNAALEIGGASYDLDSIVAISLAQSS